MMKKHVKTGELVERYIGSIHFNSNYIEDIFKPLEEDTS
jgi:hypothetical protein